MSFYDECKFIQMMKDTVVEIFGLESKKTVDFFFKADVLSFDSLTDYFYAITGVNA